MLNVIMTLVCKSVVDEVVERQEDKMFQDYEEYDEEER